MLMQLNIFKYVREVGGGIGLSRRREQVLIGVLRMSEEIHIISSLKIVLKKNNDYIFMNTTYSFLYIKESSLKESV